MTNFLSTISNGIKITGGVPRIRSATTKNLYYLPSNIDQDWNTLANWWLNDACTIQATHLPRSIDSVVIKDTVLANSGPNPVVVDLVFNPIDEYLFLSGLNITILGTAVFNTSSSIEYTTINGKTIFNNNSYSTAGSTINGDVTFNNSSFSYWTVINGNAVFNNYSINYSAINGNAIFNDYSYNELYGAVSGNAIFANTAHNCGTINGSVIGSPAPC